MSYENLGKVPIDDRGHTRTKIRCDCGRTLICSQFTNVCDCGRYFNMSGQHLNPPSMWEEPMDEGEGLPGTTDDDYQQREWEEEARYNFPIFEELD